MIKTTVMSIFWSTGVFLLLGGLGRGAVADEPARYEPKVGDRIVLIGNTLAERMQYFGHFETLLQSRFPERKLIFHNLGWSADELTLRPRSLNYADHGHQLEDEQPDVVIAAFGFNESFGGPAGLAKFRADLEKFITTTTTTAYNGKQPPTLILWTPIAHEDLGDPHITDGKANNANLKLYSAAIIEAATTHKLPSVDLFQPTARLMADRPATASPPDHQRDSPERGGGSGGRRDPRHRAFRPAPRVGPGRPGETSR